MAVSEVSSDGPRDIVLLFLAHGTSLGLSITQEDDGLMV